MFRFTIRDVLWLMVVVGMGCAWSASHRNTQKRIGDRDAQVHHFASELAIWKNADVHVSNDSGEYIITPLDARVSAGLPWFRAEPPDDKK
jgi:hypothetical protein